MQTMVIIQLGKRRTSKILTLDFEIIWLIDFMRCLPLRLRQIVGGNTDPGSVISERR